VDIGIDVDCDGKARVFSNLFSNLFYLFIFYFLDDTMASFFAT
jgi:hypothetical protein